MESVLQSHKILRLQTITAYLQLTKPGIILGNLISAMAGFFLASKEKIDISILGAMLLGLSCIIASACVFNNYLDRCSDRKMARTKNRPLARGAVSLKGAICFGVLLALFGCMLLSVFTNLLTTIAALLGFLIYVCIYTVSKRFTPLATLIGSLAGAIPPLVGFCSVTNQLSLAGWILFAILVFWQMPHFFAIAIYRFHDYENARIPILPLKRGFYVTKMHMFFYVFAFLLSAPLLTLFHFTGYFYFIGSLLLGSGWLILALQGFRSEKNILWARKMFFASLVIILGICTMIVID